MKIVALNGSHRNDGSSAFLLNRLKEKCEKNGFEMTILNTYEIMRDVKNPFCISCSSPCNGVCYKGTKLEKAFDEIDRCDLLVVCSPVYFGTVSAQLKAFFDKTKRPRAEKRWVGKLATAMAVGHSKYGGQENTVLALQSMLFTEGFVIFGDGCSYDAGHGGLCAQSPAEEDGYAIERVDILADKILQLWK